MTFKELKAIHLRKPKVWLWHRWLLLQWWWDKKFGKTYTHEEFLDLIDELKKEGCYCQRCIDYHKKLGITQKRK